MNHEIKKLLEEFMAYKLNNILILQHDHIAEYHERAFLRGRIDAISYVIPKLKKVLVKK